MTGHGPGDISRADPVSNNPRLSAEAFRMHGGALMQIGGFPVTLGARLHFNRKKGPFGFSSRRLEKYLYVFLDLWVMGGIRT